MVTSRRQGAPTTPGARGRRVDPEREQLHERFLPALDALLERVDRVYVHVDLGAIDLADGRANEFAAAGGPTLAALTASLTPLIDHGSVVAASLTSYNPDSDGDGSALRSGMQLLDTLASAALRQ